MPNIWEHVAEEKALAAAAKVEAVAAKEAKVLVEHNEGLGEKLVDEMKAAGEAIKQGFENLHLGALEAGVETFLHEHLGAASPQGSSAPATPGPTPPAEVHTETDPAKKQALLDEMRQLEKEIAEM